MALEDALARLQQAASDVEAEVKALVTETGTSGTVVPVLSVTAEPDVQPVPSPASEPVPTDSLSGGASPSATDVPASGGTGSPEGVNVAQQDIVPPAPTTEPPAEEPEPAAEPTESAAPEGA